MQFLIIGCVFSGAGGFLLALMAVDVAVMIFAIRKADGLDLIMDGLKKISDGELQYKINTDTLTGKQKVMAEYINNIGGGLDAAVENSLKKERMQTELITNVSHDLKTPLTSISGYAEIMKNGLVPAADMGRFSEKIYVEAQRLITLVGDIIKLSRLDEGNVELEKGPVDLYQIASEVVKRMGDMANKAGVAIDIKGSPAVVSGAAQLLDEMIFNICENAVKYNKPGGLVHVTVVKEKGHPTVTVEDTGIGIPEEDKERIFERFYRVDKSHSKQIGGTGLGLSIVKHGAIYHQAKVEMESRLGEGTRIRLVFSRVERSLACYQFHWFKTVGSSRN